jgi:hypothetical protein
VIKSQIYSARGDKTGAYISDQGGLYVTEIGSPPLVPQKTNPFRQYLTTDGTPSGSNDMGIDGSSTNVDFYIPASDTKDRYITALSFIVGYGASGQPNQWADGTALTNGSRLYYTSVKGEQDIHDGIKSNQDLFRLSNQLIPTSWEVRHVNTNNDYGYFIYFDLRVLTASYGIKLDRGTQQRIIMTIRDNAGTAADTFNCLAYGFERFE